MLNLNGTVLVITVLFLTLPAQQYLCYTGEGDQYKGTVNKTLQGYTCESWDRQQLIKLPNASKHNHCRALEKQDKYVYCVYKGQKQACDVPLCDLSSLLFDGSSFAYTKNLDKSKLWPIVAQQINFYFMVSAIKREKAVLVRVRSEADENQHLSVILQNGFIKVSISLDSYNTEEVLFGGPIAPGTVNFVSVNRTKDKLMLSLNDSITEHRLVNKDTVFLVSPYKIIVGDNYNGCMASLTIGSWIKTPQVLEFYYDQPFKVITDQETGEFKMLREKKGSPVAQQCMYSPNTQIRREQYNPVDQNDSDMGNDGKEGPSTDTTFQPEQGKLDTKSIVIITSALGVIFLLTGLVVICMKRNQHHHIAQGYNLEVM